MASIPNLDIQVDEKNHDEGLRDVLKTVRPDWRREDIKFKFLTQGYVNHMLVCFIDEDNKDDWIVARVFGTGIDIGQQRDHEVKNSMLFAELNLGPTVYAVFKNGLLFKYIKGKSFTWTDLTPFRDIKLCKAVARELAKVHCKHTKKVAEEKYEILKAKGIEKLMEEILSKPWPEVIIDEETTKWYNASIPPAEERNKEIQMLMDGFEWFGPKTICHGDSNPTNLIYNEEDDKVTLVDYEGVNINWPVIDLVSFLSGAAAGFAPDPEPLDFSPQFKRDFMTEYLRERHRHDGEPEEVDEKELSLYIDMYESVCIGFNYIWHAMAPMMAMAPSKDGVDKSFFLQLAVARLQVYYKKKDHMLSLMEKIKMAAKKESK